MTGHGGYCDDCEGNTSGPHCEECQLGFYRRQNENRCIDCQCNIIGSESVQCDPTGKCKCKPGVVGDKCDRCEAYHYELSNTGCKKCQCNMAGSFDSPPVCDPRDGTCRCKTNVEGQNCDRPKPGFFDLSPDNPLGAIPCFCYSHSSTCKSSTNYYKTKISAIFQPDTNFVVDYTGKKSKANLNQNELVYPVTSTTQEVWFLVSHEFLGNQLNSYNQNFSFELRIENSSYFKPRASRKDLIIENLNEKLEVYIPIYGSNSAQKTPHAQKQTFTFVLNQYSNWMPQLTSRDFQRLLTNVSSIKIRASYAPNSIAVLGNIEMTTAKPYNEKTSNQPTALFIEECTCPSGHMGERCETCSRGYRRDPINGGPFAKCVPCNCNNHSLSCDMNTGKCDCQHHTSGDNCEKCEHGYYGSPIYGAKLNQLNSFDAENVLSNLCKKCPCPNDGPCAEMFNYQLQTTEIVCLACPEGTQGNLCEMCHDGYFSQGNGLYSKCEKCTCNGNIDENAIANCEPTSGKCLKCIYNTTGDRCEKCLPNYYGNALTSFKCMSCDCFEKGSESSECNLNDGQCVCKPNVKNRRCDQCREGYWNIESASGCQECNCNPLGSFNNTCDPLSGQCYCRPGVQGKKCDSCMPLYYGFSDQGCNKCECDQLGTQFGNLQCDEFGKCPCRENFAGLKCNTCAENRFNFTNGCQRCDDCYNLVQNQVQLLRHRIKEIEHNLDLMQQNGVEIDDDQSVLLQQKLDTIKLSVDDLHSKLFHNLRPSYQDSVSYLKREVKRLSEAIKSTDQLFHEFNVLFKNAEKVYNQTSSSINQAEIQLNFIQTQNEEQKVKIEAIKEKKIDNDLNDRLQEVAREARESAESHVKLAKEFAHDISTNIAGAQNALTNIDQILAKYQMFEVDSSMIDFVDFNILATTAQTLRREAVEQKIQLEKDILVAKEVIKRIENFKIPPEFNLDEQDSQTIDLVNAVNSKKNLIKKQIDELGQKYGQFANLESILVINNAKTELNKAAQKQKGIEYLLEYSENVLNEANLAHNLTKELVANASKILETLQKFDQLILKGKQDILQAESFRPDTEQNIRDSENLYALLKERLDMLEIKLDESKSHVTETNTKLTEAKQTFDGLDGNLTELNKMSMKLMNEVNELNSSLDTFTKPKSNEAFEELANFDSRNELILKKTESLTNRTQHLLDSTNNALEDLLRINKTYIEFSTSSNLKKEDINQLEQRFENVSLLIDDNSGLDESIEILELRTKYLLNRVKEYNFHLEELNSQVKNLEEINNSLERKCYANTFAKPELF
ncbi:Laminin subunit gamma-1 [Brachionus plicatilis]|uniref:Laminin subunit gamma-1 n=1 Tax=Brachionus plicatilis TaxID=10195 RepID=A0A3M7RCS5_BRAPC|nr:Laminin subunit gamma-1 [Brachionus plicatilis]